MALWRQKIKQFPRFVVRVSKHVASQVTDVIAAKRFESEGGIHRPAKFRKPRQIPFVQQRRI
jgi:hypothetical protein